MAPSLGRGCDPASWAVTHLPPHMVLLSLEFLLLGERREGGFGVWDLLGSGLGQMFLKTLPSVTSL